MYPVSAAYKAAMNRRVKTRRISGTIGSITFDESNIVVGTLKTDNACSSSTELTLGYVNIGQLSCVFRGIDLTGEWMGKIITISESLLVDEDEDTWESVPIGVYHVVEALHQDTGVYIVAYDVMDYMDKDFIYSASVGTPYDYLMLIEEKCGVEFSQTEEEIRALPNGSLAFGLYEENSISTYRDLLFWIAQAMACFATATRDGKVELRRFGGAPVDSLGPRIRWQGSSISDYTTRYTGVSLTKIEDQSTIYRGAAVDDALTYNLGGNPLLQTGSAQIPLQNILNALLEFAYTPFSVDRAGSPAYDLGDALELPFGDAVKVGCMMSYEYDYHDVYMIDGFGANPELANAKSKTDKEISGLLARSVSDTMQYYTYTNAEELEIRDDYKDIISVRFASAKSTLVTFHAEIKLKSTIEEEDIESVVGNIKYLWNDTEMDYHPAETWIDGEHLLHLMYLIPIQEAATNRLKVRLNCDGGVIEIGRADINAYIAGQGLVATSTWDGWIECEDNITEIEVIALTEVDAYTDELTLNLVAPIVIEITDSIVPVEVDGTPIIAEYQDAAYVNKEPLRFLTWQAVKDYGTWQNIFDDYAW